MPPYTDQWLSSAILAAFFGCALLTTVFSALSVQYHEKYVKTWAWGWAFLALHYLIQLLIVPGLHPESAQPLLDLATLTSVLFLLAGTGQFVQRRFVRISVGCGVTGSLWIILSTFADLPYWLEVLPLGLFLAGVLSWTGYLFLRMAKRSEQAAHFTGWGLILWGLHKAVLPFFGHSKAVVPWGFLSSGILAFAVAMGMLIACFQRVRDVLQESEQRFRAISTYPCDWEIWLGTNGQPLWVNSAAIRMSGIPSEEALVMPDYPLPLIEKDDRAAIRAALALVADGGIVDDQLFRVRRRDDSSFWASLSAQQVFAADETLLGSRLSIRDITTLIHYQEGMERKSRLLQSVLDNTSDAILALNQEFRVIFGNNRFVELWGISRSFLDQHPTVREIIVEACRIGLYLEDEVDEVVKQRLAHLSSGGKVVLKTPRQDGLIVEAFASRLPDIGYLLAYRDITAREAVEEKAREQADFIQTILDTIPAPIFYKGADAIYLGCNTAFEDYIGRSRTEVVGKSVFDLSPPDLAQIYYDADIELLRRGGTQSYETEAVFADGHRHDVLFSKAVFSHKDGVADGLVGAMLDITARKSAERELAASESRYKKLFHEFETIFNGIPDPLSVWSSDMRVLWANSSSGGQNGKLAGEGCREICSIDFTPEDDCEVRRAFSSGLIEKGIHRARDGRTWGVKAFPLHNTAGIVDRVIRLASDLTERMVLREEAARAAHLAALGELAAGMAHEINNPTSLILLEMPILRDVFRDSGEILEEYFKIHGDFSCGGIRYSRMRQEVPAMIDEILDGAERIKHIVEDLKDFSQPNDLKEFEAVDLNAVVRKALSLVGTQIKKTTDHFQISYAPNAAMSPGSLQRLEQVVINLVINACQAMPEQGCTLSIEVGSWPKRRRNFIRVADTGIGIQPEHLKLITDPFFTTRRAAGGTGLGLSVSTRIIEECGGTLQFASKPGEGTTVTVELPLAAEEDFP